MTAPPHISYVTLGLVAGSDFQFRVEVPPLGGRLPPAALLPKNHWARVPPRPDIPPSLPHTPEHELRIALGGSAQKRQT